MKLNPGNRKSFKAISLSLVLITISYLIGALSHSRNLWPIEMLREIKNTGEAFATSHEDPLIQVDSLKRVTSYPGKQQVDCPVQAKDTGVLLIMGQSNAANQAQKKFTTHFPNQVVNYFDGRCYVASSPLLGGTGQDGEFITPLADELISQGTYANIVIIDAAVGGSPISRWQRDGDLNESLIALIKELRAKYQITDVIWHQGETDAAAVFRTTTKLYVASFSSLLDTLTDLKVDAPVFIAIATRCSAADWEEGNPTAIGQRMLIDNRRVFLGANTDKLVELRDRYDACHFSETGQIIVAKAFAESISATKNSSGTSRISNPKKY
jgi:hypothetical protein